MEDEQTLADADQTLAEGDQTGSDSDQTAADTDQEAADSDQAAADSDQEASDRDLAGGGDPDVHDATVNCAIAALNNAATPTRSASKRLLPAMQWRMLAIRRQRHAIRPLRCLIKSWKHVMPPRGKGNRTLSLRSGR